LIIVSSNSPSSEKTVDEENKKNSELTALSKENGHVNGKIPNGDVKENGTVDSDKENSKPQSNGHLKNEDQPRSLSNGSAGSLDRNSRANVGLNTNRQKKRSEARDEVDNDITTINGTTPKIKVSEDIVSTNDVKFTEALPDRDITDSAKERRFDSGIEVSVAEEELPSEVFSVQKGGRNKRSTGSVSTDDIELDLNGDGNTRSVAKANGNTRKASRDSTLSNDSFASCSDKMDVSSTDINGLAEEAVELESNSSIDEVKEKNKSKRKIVYTSPGYLNNMRSGLRKTNRLNDYLQ